MKHFNQTDLNFTGINFNFCQDKFYVSYRPCGRPIQNLRKEFETRAKNLSNYSKKLMLCLSSGLDSQAVMHSFFSQGIKIDYAFLYQPGFNETEYENIQILEKKYNFKAIVIEIDPEKVKDKVLDLHKKLNLPPNQILHKMFVEQLPEDADILQGVHGPDFLQHENNVVISPPKLGNIFKFFSINGTIFSIESYKIHFCPSTYFLKIKVNSDAVYPLISK